MDYDITNFKNQLTGYCYQSYNKNEKKQRSGQFEYPRLSYAT